MCLWRRRMGCSGSAGAGVQSAFDVHRLFSEGIEGREIRQLASYFGPFDDELTYLLEIKQRTLQRRERGAFTAPRTGPTVAGRGDFLGAAGISHQGHNRVVSGDSGAWSPLNKYTPCP